MPSWAHWREHKGYKAVYTAYIENTFKGCSLSYTQTEGERESWELQFTFHRATILNTFNKLQPLVSRANFKCVVCLQPKYNKQIGSISVQKSKHARSHYCLICRLNENIVGMFYSSKLSNCNPGQFFFLLQHTYFKLNLQIKKNQWRIKIPHYPKRRRSMYVCIIFPLWINKYFPNHHLLIGLPSAFRSQFHQLIDRSLTAVHIWFAE